MRNNKIVKYSTFELKIYQQVTYLNSITGQFNAPNKPVPLMAVPMFGGQQYVQPERKLSMLVPNDIYVSDYTTLTLGYLVQLLPGLNINQPIRINIGDKISIGLGASLQG